jgi:cytoskeletal protein CcmA (bactofilin family)
MTKKSGFNFRLAMVIALTFACIFFAPQAALAQGIFGGDRVPAGNTIHGDRFLYGTTVAIEGNVDGDVFVIGTEIVLNGDISGSLVAIGQKVSINGMVGGTLYSTALEIELGPEANLNRNLYFAGASMNTQEGSLVNRDLYAAALGAQTAGVVNGELKAIIGPAEFFFLLMDRIDQTNFLTSSNPEIIILKSDNRALQNISGGSVASASLMSLKPILAAFERYPLQEAGSIDWVLVGNWFLERAREWAILLIFSILSLWLMPRLLPASAQLLRAKPLPATGWGMLGVVISFNMIGVVILLTIIIVAFGMFLGVITLWDLAWAFMAIGGFSLGLAATIFALFVIYVSKAIVALLAGQWILKRIAPSVSHQNVLSLMLGLLIYVFLAAIPILGWIAGILVTALGIGAAWLFYRSQRNPVALPEPTSMT